MQKNYKLSVYVWILFLISPFLSLIISIRNYKVFWAKNVAWAFIVFYGFNFVIFDELMDANRYAENFVILHNKEITLDNFLSSLLSDEESTYLDFASPVIIFITSRFTDNPTFLFAVFAMVFGYFYTRNLWYLLEKVEEKILFLSVLVFAIASLVIPFWSMNGFRFWTASHIFIYGLLPFLFEGRQTRHLLIASISILFHFSFIVPVAILLSTYFFSINIRILFYLFLSTFLISSVNLQALQEFLMQYAPAILQKKLQSYVNQDYADSLESARQASKWFIILRSEFTSYFALILTSILYYTKLETIKSNKAFFAVFAFILYYSLIANLLCLIPSGGRFLQISYFLLYGFIFLLLTKYYSEALWLRRVVCLALPLILFFIIFQLRIGFQTMNILLIVGNPLISAVDPGMAILDFLKR